MAASRETAFADIQRINADRLIIACSHQITICGMPSLQYPAVFCVYSQSFAACIHAHTIHSLSYFYRILLHRLSQSNCVGFVFISSRCLCIVEHIHSTNLLSDFSFSFVRICHRYFCYAEWESSNSDEICEVFIYFLNDLLNFVDVQCRTVSIFVARAWIKRKAC